MRNNGDWKKSRGQKRTRCCYVAEGETEKRFTDQLKKNELIKPGRFYKCNLMQNELRETSSLLDYKGAVLFCIIDTDKTARDNLDKLSHNIRLLQESFPGLCVLVQNRMLEDELAYMLGKSLVIPLCHFLGGSGKDSSSAGNFKRFLQQHVNYFSPGHRITKEHLTHYCERPGAFTARLRQYGQNYADVMEKIAPGSTIIM